MLEPKNRIISLLTLSVSKKNKKRLLVYSIIGVISTLLYLVLLYLLVEFINIHPIIATAIVFIITVVLSYIANYKLTYNSKHAHIVSFSKYIIVVLFGLSTNLAVVYFFMNYFMFHYLAAQMFVVIFVPLQNYILNTAWVFNS